MGVTHGIDVTPRQRRTILRLIERHLPETDIWAYGSRAKWTSHPSSDLDLVAFAGPHQRRQIADLREAFEESNLPFRVDLFVWDEIPETFREQIDDEHVVVVEMPSTPHVPTSWSQTTLDSLLGFSNGCSSPARSSDLPFPVFGSNGVIGRCRDSNSRPGTIVIGRVGSNCGSLRFSDTSCWVTDKAIRATAIGDHDPRFLFYLLRTLQLNTRHIGSRQPMLTQAVLASIRTFVPPLAEQRAIAHVLGTLDDRIELSHRMTATLEAMAQALFEDWFVDFGPVYAKVENRATGLPPVLDRLFPSSFEASKLGEIPAGWDVRKLSDVMNVNPPRTLRHGDVATYVKMAALPTSGPHVEAWTRRPFTSGSRFTRGDTLLARITPSMENGKAALVDFLDDGEVAWGSTEFTVLRPKPPWPHEIAYILVRCPDFREHSIINMTGTSGRQRVPASAIAAYPVAVPPPNVVEAFGQVIRPWFEHATYLARQAFTSSAQRDALLPRLLSGALRVSRSPTDTAQ